MKEFVLALGISSMFLLVSFTKNAVNNNDADAAAIAETLVGNWKFKNTTRNGQAIQLSSCDRLDFLNFTSSGKFESLQHMTIINAKTGSGTKTDCSPIRTKGKWLVSPEGELIRNNQKMKVLEITENLLKIESTIEITNAKFEKETEVYVDSYYRN